MWPTIVQDFLASGEAPNFHTALIVWPVNLISEQTEEVSYWSGWEPVDLNLGGVRSLIPTSGALGVGPPTYSEGTDIRNQDCRMFGRSVQAASILKSYNVRFKPAETWQLCFTQGAAFMGARRLFKGFVDGTPQRIGVKGQGATLSIKLASAMRTGTRTVVAKKSHASYQLRGGDTAMEYASLTSVDSDWWGARG